MATKIIAQLLYCGRRDNAEVGGAGGKVEGRIWLGKFKGNGLVIDRRDFGQRAGLVFGWRGGCRVEHPVEGKFDRFGVYRGAIMELAPFPQDNGQDLAIFADRPRLGQQPLGQTIGADVEEFVVDPRLNGGRRRHDGLMRVERIGVFNIGDHNVTAGRRFPSRGWFSSISRG